MLNTNFALSLVTVCLLLLAVHADDTDTEKLSKTWIVNPQPNPYYMEVSDGTLAIECRSQPDTSTGQLYWLEDGEAVNDGDNGVTIELLLDGDERVSVLRKDSVYLDDSATYECRREEDEADSGAKIRIYMFQIVTQEDTVAVIDEDLELQCYVEGDLYEGYKPLQWFKGPELIRADNDKYFINDYNDTLLITDMEREDVQDYICGFTLENGQSFNATVDVECEPYVKKLGTSKNLVQGDPLVLDCDAWGIPTPEITWLKDDEPIPDDDERVTYSDHEGLANASIRIENMDFEDYADYTCLAENVHGNATTTILVRVKDKLAALWPFLGICCEVAILCLIIFIYEKRRSKKMAAEEARMQEAEAEHLTNSTDQKGDVRHRK